MYLFFDTETTGLPLDWKAPVTNLNNWPRMVQLAYLIYDKNGNKIKQADFIIQPEGFVIPKDASKVHGISTEKAIAEGASLIDVLNEFFEDVQQSDFLVAHNMAFDEKIVGAELLRKNKQNIIPLKKQICTMQSTINYCKLPSKYGFKWPKLTELHTALFNEGFDEAHNALVDISITAKCFWELKRNGIIQ